STTNTSPTLLPTKFINVLLSEKIREIARAYGVPVLRRPELARTIYSTVEPGNSIPPALYVAVAEVLAMIYRMRHKSK
ncbi:unnamed protein product, partial [marine sediment metagenome]